MQGTSRSFTLLHDVKKLNNGDFERFGLLVALALTYCCPGPRNMQESMVWALLQLPIDDGNIEDIPPFLNLFADKDTVIKNIIHHCCISSCLEETRSVQKGMSTLGVSIVSFFSVTQCFFSIAFQTITTVTWSHVSFLANLFLQMKLP